MNVLMPFVRSKADWNYVPFVLLSLPILFGLVSPASFAQEDQKPNVIVLLADDLGWNGLQSYGSDLHETPNVDRLVQEGMKFTDAYAASPVCSPTRAAIMTGQHPARLRVTNWITGFNFANSPLVEPDWTKKLPLSRTTIAETLKKEGYATAHLGKWHLGPESNYPEHQGFDVNVGGGHWGSPPGGYFLPNKLPLENVDEGYLTDHLTKRAVEIIERWQDRPFFMYFAYYLVHTPIQGKPELVTYYKRKIKEKREEKGELIHDNPEYAAMVHTLDQSVGKILATLDRVGIENETLIVFTSDNGGLSRRFGKLTGITMNDPLRRGKGAGYEGGIRVPFVVRWPGRVESGTVRKEPVITMDVPATILDATGASRQSPEGKSMDGRSLMPLLNGSKASLERSALYWHFPHYHPGGVPEGPFTAVRKGPLKLLQFHEGPSYELYNLNRDLGESRNLHGTDGERAASLRTSMEKWLERVDAQMPRPNPDYDPEKNLRGK